MIINSIINVMLFALVALEPVYHVPGEVVQFDAGLHDLYTMYPVLMKVGF